MQVGVIHWIWTKTCGISSFSTWVWVIPSQRLSFMHQISFSHIGGGYPPFMSVSSRSLSFFQHEWGLSFSWSAIWAVRELFPTWVGVIPQYKESGSPPVTFSHLWGGGLSWILNRSKTEHILFPTHVGVIHLMFRLFSESFISLTQVGTFQKGWYNELY